MTGLPPSLLGFWVSGDLAGQTVYTNRRGLKVYYKEAPAGDPASPQQTAQRLRFKNAQAAWMALPRGWQNAYEELVNQASLCLTGQNLWIKVSLGHKVNILTTLQRQTGITVPTPPLF